VIATRKIAAILCSDVVGYSRLAGADEDRILARLRALRSDLIDPTISVHHGRVVKRTGDGSIVEFRSVVDAVRCAIELQNAMVERNAGVPEDRRIVFRIGIHLSDVVEESDGDLMGDGVNIAARLEGIAAPGAICLSEQAYWQVKGRLDLAVTDLGPTQLKNIAEPIRAYSLQVGVPAVAKAAPAAMPASEAKSASEAEPPEPRKRSALAPLALAIAALLVAIAAGAWYFLVATRPSIMATMATAPARSIVVLPLSNLSGDAAQDYLVDALTDELTTSISRLPGTFVIARNTAFTFKGKPSDAKAIGKDLGVKYVLEGSVQPTATRIRVNAQLIDAESGAHLWAESFDEERADLLQMEDDIVTRLARTLDFKMTDVEAAEARRLRPGNLGAQDLALQCLARANDNLANAADPVKHPEIYEFCEQALRLDPGNTLALRLLAGRLGQSFIRGADMTAETERLDDLVGKALAVDPNDGNARYAKGLLALNVHARGDEAVVEFERAIAENPSNIAAYAYLGTIYINAGQAEKAVAVFDKAMRLSPHDPILAKMLRWKADALEFLGRDEEASVVGNQALALTPNDPQILRKQAATLGNLGRDAEARELYQRYAALMGGKLATIPQYRAYMNSFGGANIPSVVAFREHVLDGLRKAGMPEQ
jgi:adenylate cyclase